MRLAHSKSARIFGAVTAGAVAVTIGALAAPSAGAANHTVRVSGTSHGGAAAVKGGSSTILFQNATDDTGVGIVSQNFETTFDQYDAQGADDFKVPKGHTWKIKEVDAPGVYFNGSGPATSETVYFYKNSSGLPGALVKSKTKTGGDTAGTFAIKLGRKGVKLSSGKYWVSVQANMDFSTGGEWGWETPATQTGLAAAWQNPGGGFGVGCQTWGVMQTCLGAQGEGPDFEFTLKGVQS